MHLVKSIALPVLLYVIEVVIEVLLPPKSTLSNVYVNVIDRAFYSTFGCSNMEDFRLIRNMFGVFDAECIIDFFCQRIRQV